MPARMTPERLALVLVRTRLSSNLGSLARVAKNFGLKDLRLVEPAAAADDEALRLASGADDVLDRSRRYTALSEAGAGFRDLGATCAASSRAPQAPPGPRA